MKAFIYLLTTLFILFSPDLLAQGRWTEKSPLPAGPRERAFHFTIDDKLYVGGGRSFRGAGFIAPSPNENDVWVYDFETDTWEERNPFPGTPFRNGASFVINGIAYVATGFTDAYSDLFWKYDPDTDSWEELPPFPGGARSFPVAFSLNGKGYLGLGGILSGLTVDTVYNDLWEFDPITEDWTRKSDFPGQARARPFGFVMGDTAYVGGGDVITSSFQDFYRYDPATDSWGQLSDFPSPFSLGCYSFTLDEKGYVGEGAQNEFELYGTRVWEYDPADNLWNAVSFTPGFQEGRTYFFSGTYQGKAYLGGGANPSNFTIFPIHGDFYEWDKDASPALPDYESWESLGRGTVDTTQNRFYRIQAIDEDTIWAIPTRTFLPDGSPLEITRSFDGGATWNTYSIDGSARYRFANFFALDGNRVFMTASLAEPAGKTFIYTTADGGQNWTVSLDSSANLLAEGVGLHFFDGQTGLCWGNDGGLFTGGSLKIYRTTDAGSSWTLLQDPDLPTPNNFQYNFPLSGNTGYDAVGDTIWLAVSQVPFVGNANALFRSTDQGATWTQAASFPHFIWTVAFQDGQQGMLAGDNTAGIVRSRIYTTEDGGETWTEIPAPELPLSNALEYIPGTPGGYLIHSARYPDYRIGYTPNFGKDWYTTIAPPVLNSVQFLSQDLGFAGGPVRRDIESGIFKWAGNFQDIIEAGRIYVKADAAGANDGSSWADAFTTLQEAIDSAEAGNTIWMAGGTYYTDPQKTDTTLSFVIDKDLSIYGGFAGTELNLSERDTSLGNETILTGDLNEDDDPDSLLVNRSDNALRVMVVEAVTTNQTLIEGLTIQGGHKDPASMRWGGGMEVWGTPIVKNCIFLENYAAEDGGGVYVFEAAGKQDVARFEYCHFSNNEAAQDGGALTTFAPLEIMSSSFVDNRSTRRGGAVYVIGSSSGTTTISDGSFSKNRSTEGGGVYVLGAARNNTFHLKRTSFLDNEALSLTEDLRPLAGGIIILLQDDASDNMVSVDSCSFSGNTSTLGGGLYFVDFSMNSNFNLTRSSFQKNAVFDSSSTFLPLGGGLYGASFADATDGYYRIDNCAFEENRSEGSGGGLRLFIGGQNAKVEVQNTQFNGNETADLIGAVGGGGAVEVFGFRDTVQFLSCSFHQNESNFSGGLNLISFGAEEPVINVDSCHFTANQATVAGGGLVHNFFASSGKVSGRIHQCEFIDNIAGENGGGLGLGGYFVDAGSIVTEGNRFIGNQAANGGGVVAFPNMGLDLTITQSRFEGNSASTQGGGVVIYGNPDTRSKMTVSYSEFIGNQSPAGAAVALDTTINAYEDTLGTPIDAEIRIDHIVVNGCPGEGSALFTASFPDVRLTSSTIANNQTDGLSLGQNGNIDIQNTIFFNPGQAEFASGSLSTGITSLGGNLIGDSSMAAFLTGLDLQEMDPLFEMDTFQLSPQSPAIDAGVLPDSIPPTDLAGNLRVQGNGIDMGAFESSFTTSLTESYVDNRSLTLWPNPAHHQLNVSIASEWQGVQLLGIYNAYGQKVLEERLNKATSEWTGQVDVSRLASGTYFLVLSDGKKFTSKAFAKE